MHAVPRQDCSERGLDLLDWLWCCGFVFVSLCSAFPGRTQLTAHAHTHVTHTLQVRINNGVWYKLYFSSTVRLQVAAYSGAGTPNILRVVGKFSGVMRIAAISNDKLGPSYASAAAAASGWEAVYDANSDIYPTGAVRVMAAAPCRGQQCAARTCTAHAVSSRCRRVDAGLAKRRCACVDPAALD